MDWTIKHSHSRTHGKEFIPNIEIMERNRRTKSWGMVLKDEFFRRTCFCQVRNWSPEHDYLPKQRVLQNYARWRCYIKLGKRQKREEKPKMKLFRWCNVYNKNRKRKKVETVLERNGRETKYAKYYWFTNYKITENSNKKREASQNQQPVAMLYARSL